ncbi:MAG: hypothetical protein DRQ40_03585, partial [Gammaproteobacteria bacterium]
MEKRSKSQVSTSSFIFKDGSQVKCTVTPNSTNARIVAGGGNYLFSGIDANAVQGNFEALRNKKIKDDPNYTPVDKGKEVLPSNKFIGDFPAAPAFPNRDKVPRFTWADIDFIVASGAGQRYHTNGINYVVHEHYDARLSDIIPTVLYPTGVPLAEGKEGSEAIAASVFGDYVLGITKRGKLRYWQMGDSENIVEMDLPMPPWVGDPITIHYNNGTTDNVQQAWGLGDGGVQWNFNRAGTAVCGLITYYKDFRNYDDNPEADPLYYSENVGWQIRLNPEIDDEGKITFGFEHYDLGQSLALQTIDWNYLPSNKTEDIIYSIVVSKTFVDYNSTVSVPIDDYEGDAYNIQRVECRSLQLGHVIYKKNLSIVRYNVYYIDS